MKFKNLEVKPESLTKPGYNVSWEIGDVRYHVWTDDRLTIRNGILYKNPLREVTHNRPDHEARRDPRFFETRRLQSGARSNRKMIDEVLDRVDVLGLFDAADKDRADRQAAVDREHAKQMRLRRMQDAAPELFAALKDARDKIASGRAMDAYDDLGALIAKIDG